MFSMTNSMELDEEQRQDADVNKCHYGGYKILPIKMLTMC